jgi:hypothetical protein
VKGYLWGSERRYQISLRLISYERDEWSVANCSTCALFLHLEVWTHVWVRPKSCKAIRSSRLREVGEGLGKRVYPPSLHHFPIGYKANWTELGQRLFVASAEIRIK